MSALLAPAPLLAPLSRASLAFERPAELQAVRPPEERGLARDQVRLLVSRPGGHEHASFTDLPRILPRGTLLVVNRSATLPASLPAEGAPGTFRLNLCTDYGGGLWLAEPRWTAAAPGPLPLRARDRIRVGGLSGSLVARYPGLDRLWFVQISGDVVRAMHRSGEPIRYGYLQPPFPPLGAYQTLFGNVPGSAEMPSAGRPFSRRVIRNLRGRGIQLAGITLHTGVSSLDVETDQVDAQPLFAEPFRVPRSTAAAVNEARWDGRPVIAVGTTVVRALESAWDGARVRPAAGFSRRFVRPASPPLAVDGLITGFHDPLASHLALLYALAGKQLVRDGYQAAVREGYLWHEFGDSHLLLPGRERLERLTRFVQ